MPGALEYLRERTNKDGLTLSGMHKRITAELLRVGRFGILPSVDDKGVFNLAGYTAEAIINWDGVPADYVVLDESGQVRNPATNNWQTEKRFRECYTNEVGVYTSREWMEAEGEKDEYIQGEEIVAKTNKGKGLEGLPFVFIDSMDLSAEPDDIPLYGLAKLAFRAYRLDADYVTALHMTSEPTPWVSGVSKEAAPKTIGAASLWILENDAAKAGFLEFNGPGISEQEKAIKNTLERAITFGAQLFADNNRAAESGDALRLRLGSQTSTLKMLSLVGAAGLEKALKNTAIWAGSNPDEVVVKPNMDFVDHELSPQEVTALVSSWQSGAYSKLTMFENLQNGGWVNPERTFEEEEELINSDDPLGLMGNADGAV